MNIRDSYRVLLAIILVLSFHWFSPVQTRAEELHETFSKPVLDLSVWNLYPAWDLTSRHTLLATDEEKSKNKHISTRDKWDIDLLECKIRVKPTEVPGSNVRLTISFSKNKNRNCW